MISVEDARDRILAFFERLAPEQAPVIEALGQVLAEDVVAGFDIPPLDNTAMDGYAVRAADTDGSSEGDPRRLTVIADLAAGYVLDTAVGEGEAVRIMTGAPIPPGADAIVPFEETDEPLREPGQAPTRGDAVGVFKAALPGANIRRRAEDIGGGAGGAGGGAHSARLGSWRALQHRADGGLRVPPSGGSHPFHRGRDRDARR